MSKKNFTKTRVLERLEIGPERIDRDAGVIRGVKVLGLQSRNPAKVIGIRGPAGEKPYRYSREAVQQAMPLYEKVKVNIDHPELISTPEGRVRPKGGRKFGEGFGWIQNVRIEEGGLYGDLHYLKSHELAERVLEWVDRRSDAIAMSHDAMSQPTVTAEGECVITKIVRVNSVDLIWETPGTTNGLFESADESEESGTVSDAIAALRGCLEAADELTEAEAGELSELIPVLESKMSKPDAAAPDEKVTPPAGAPAGAAPSPSKPDAPLVLESAEKAELEKARKKLEAVRTLERLAVPVTESRIEMLADANETIAVELCRAWKAGEPKGVADEKPKSAAPPKPTLESAADPNKQPKSHTAKEYMAAFRGGSLN